MMIWTGYIPSNSWKIAVIPGDGIGIESIPEGIRVLEAVSQRFASVAGRAPGDIDMMIVRENTEGEYSFIVSRMFSGTDREIVVQETVMSLTGVGRILKYAFYLAEKRGGYLISATKSNGISITMPYWGERVVEVASQHPGIKVDKYHIGILTAQFVLYPDWCDVVVSSNLFGDTLCDLGHTFIEMIGIVPSGNINPEGIFPSLFEPVHGSAPDISGQGAANPVGQIWAAAIMLQHRGAQQVGESIVAAIECVLPEEALCAPDLGGPADTKTCGAAIADAVSECA